MIKDKILKRGQIAVNKKRLLIHCDELHTILSDIDILMKKKESYQRGKNIAIIMNRLQFSLHTIEHFDLGIPLNKLK